MEVHLTYLPLPHKLPPPRISHLQSTLLMAAPDNVTTLDLNGKFIQASLTLNSELRPLV